MNELNKTEERTVMTESFLEDSACSVAKPCPTPCDPMKSNPPSSSVHGISQARILELDSHALLQGIFLTQGSNSHPLLGRWILYHWPTRKALLEDGWVKMTCYSGCWTRITGTGLCLNWWNLRYRDWENYTESVTSDLFCCDENVKYFWVFLLLFWIVTVAIQFVQNIHFQYFKQRFTYYFYRQNLS